MVGKRYEAEGILSNRRQGGELGGTEMATLMHEIPVQLGNAIEWYLPQDM